MSSDTRIREDRDVPARLRAVAGMIDQPVAGALTKASVLAMLRDALDGPEEIAAEEEALTTCVHGPTAEELCNRLPSDAELAELRTADGERGVWQSEAQVQKARADAAEARLARVTPEAVQAAILDVAATFDRDWIRPAGAWKIAAAVLALVAADEQAAEVIQAPVGDFARPRPAQAGLTIPDAEPGLDRYWQTVKPGERVLPGGAPLHLRLDRAPEGTEVKLPDTTEAIMRHGATPYVWRGDDDSVYTSAQLAKEGPLTVVSVPGVGGAA